MDKLLKKSEEKRNKIGPVEIIRNLWIGNYKDVCDKFLIKKLNFDIIINVSKDLEYEKLPNIKYKRVPIDDNPSISYLEDNEKLLSIFPNLIEFIHISLKNNKKIFVHCYAGKQRSAAVIAGYLMKYGELKFDEVIEILRSKREIIFKPECNFKHCLYKYSNYL
jgi:rhodanese-related sulfurtransferase